MNRSSVFITLFLLGSTSFCQAANTSPTTPSIYGAELAQYRLEAINFVGSQSFSTEQLKRAFNVPVGHKFDHKAVGQGLERLRLIYGDHGYINFTAVPTFQIDRHRETVVLTVSIDDGAQFTFGQLFLTGQETRKGEADALHKAWAALSGKTYDSSLFYKWISENAPFLANGGRPPCRQIEMHVSTDTRQADIGITFPSPKS
jgi:outer membrane protein assembly factor BamA